MAAVVNLAEPVLTDDWVSPRYIAYHYGHCVRLIQKWCKNGTLIDFGFTVYQASNKRWWIKKPAVMTVNNDS